MLEVKDLHIGYSRALNHEVINGKWNKGDLVVLMGDNGVGKSTFLKTLAGLIPSISGNVSLQTEKIGWVDSSISKGVYLSVDDFLSFGIEACSAAKHDWLTNFNLDFPIDKFIDELSDGQFRKLCIIRQLLKKPEVLFLDEPTVYLDVKSKEKLAAIVNELKKDCLIFCSTHDLAFADAIQTEVIRF